MVRMREDRESLVRNLAEFQRLAETRLLQERHRLEAKVQEGELRQTELQLERNQLQLSTSTPSGEEVRQAELQQEMNQLQVSTSTPSVRS